MTPNGVSPYVAGWVNLPANSVVGLLEVIRNQLDPLCSGGPREFTLFVRSGGNVFVGSYSKISGPLSQSNFAYVLGAGEFRTYQSSFPGSTVPLGQIQVLAATSTGISVEVIA